LPSSICTLGELIDRTATAVDGEHVDIVFGMSGNEAGRLVYCGKSDLCPWERMRRHTAHRKRGDVSAFDTLIAVLGWWRGWGYVAAPPSAFQPFVIAAVERLRAQARATGELSARRDARLDLLLADPAPWMTTRLVEWLVIATAGPLANQKGNVYTDGTGRVVRPLDVLLRFAKIAGQEARREANPAAGR
jgi:hypothetical protein